MKLSIIIPFCCEYPQILYTWQNIHLDMQEFRDKNPDYDFEIIVINNWCEQARKQVAYHKELPGISNTPHKINREWLEEFTWCKGWGGDESEAVRTISKGGRKMESLARLHPELKYIHYTDKLSHWNAKNAGVEASTGEVLFFIDAHCILYPGAIGAMWKYYIDHYNDLHGTLHMPWGILGDLRQRRLIYKPVINIDKGVYDYSATRYTSHFPQDKPFKVTAMSTCGMMMSHTIYHNLGGWPKYLGIYGGGENFINYTLAVLGYHKWIYPGYPFFHHSERRGYNFEHWDYIKNKALAVYIYGGKSRAEKFLNASGAKTADTMAKIERECEEHRIRIVNQQVFDIDEWVRKREVVI